MKTLIALFAVSLGFTLIATDAYARGGGNRGGNRGGGSRASHSRSSAPARRAAPTRRATPTRSSAPARRATPTRSASRPSTAHRSPTTGSKINRSNSKPSSNYTRQATRPTQKPTTRPTTRPSTRPSAKPSTRPAAKPSTRPATKPSTRPSAKPTTRPSTRPGAGNKPTTRPSTRPGAGNKPTTRPSTRPGAGNKPTTRPGAGNKPTTRPGTGNNRPGNGNNRPGAGNNRPSTLPGMVTYPNRPGNNRPGAGNNRPGAGNNRPGLGNNNRPSGRPGTKNNRPNRNNVGNKVNTGNRTHINNVNVGRRNKGMNRPSTLPANKRNWNSNKWGGNRGVWGNNNNININNNNIRISNNFRNSNNFAYRPNYWGARPWWGAGASHAWHRGHWNYGWSNRYYHRHWYCGSGSFASGFVWGIAAWSLGNMIYSSGYNTYHNPYPAPSVTYNVYPPESSSGTTSSKSSINYSEPVSVTAAATPPGDEESAELAETKSDAALERSRTAFKQRDYLAAMKAVDEAIAHTPGDVTLHEYRALVFFALGRFADAAGVLNPVLASGPGWGWDTMIEFYDSTTTYDSQVAKLEAYVKGTPKAADARFVLGYQYLVQGKMQECHDQFAEVVELQPADGIARQLRDLAKSSLPDDESEDATEQPAAPRPDPVPVDQLVGTWVSDRGDAGKITFKMEESGKFVWNFSAGDQSSELKGTYGMDDEGLLVLSMEEDDSQMISIVEMKDEKDMHFTIVGSPDGDPGLDFKKG